MGTGYVHNLWTHSGLQIHPSNQVYPLWTGIFEVIFISELFQHLNTALSFELHVTSPCRVLDEQIRIFPESQAATSLLGYCHYMNGDYHAATSM